MRKYLALLIILLLVLLFASCGSHKFQNREINMIMTVDTIIGDTAILQTRMFKAEYFVDSKDRYIGEKQFFMLWVYDCGELPREFKAKIRKVIPANDKVAIRRAMKQKRYLNL